jgi:hypothetical protein
MLYINTEWTEGNGTTFGYFTSSVPSCNPAPTISGSVRFRGFRSYMVYAFQRLSDAASPLAYLNPFSLKLAPLACRYTKAGSDGSAE